MFKILGADGKEYGPISVDQLKQWITEGRANQETMAQREGDTGWKRMGDYPDFAGAFSATGPTGAPPATPMANAPDPGGRAIAEAKVSGPAIGLIITGGLVILMAMWRLLSNVLGTGIGMMGAPSGGAEIPPEVQRMMVLFGGTLGIVASIVSMAAGAFIIYGALQMKKLRSHGISAAASVLAMIPCFSGCCCLLGLPIGIWALVVILKPEVKSHFS